MNTLSHKISLVRRKEITNLRSIALVTPITDHIRSRLALAMRNQNIRKQVEMFRLFNSLASSKALSGIIFENICHQQFQRRIHIDYVPMVWLEDGSRREWHSSTMLSPRANSWRDNDWVLWTVSKLSTCPLLVASNTMAASHFLSRRTFTTFQ
ncbi:hypothetical protein BJV77DRAFT_223369 [Russula vinacea]|nr:hypothetical protein BJV77DRAFT_223369 [Russula vinacea]